MIRREAMTPRELAEDDIERAIKLLQQKGYSVFKDAAKQVLSASERVESLRIAQYNNGDDRFIEYTQRKMAASLGEHLLTSGAAVFEVLPPTPGSPEWMQTFTELRLYHRFWQDNRKEWRR